MRAKDYRIAAHAGRRTTRCWKNRCSNVLPGALGLAEGEQQAAALQPAFRDKSTGAIYPSRFTDGRLAPVHVLDGLPSSAVLARLPDGRVAALQQTIEAGFQGGGHFYTREQAAAMCDLSSLPHRRCAAAPQHVGHQLVSCSVESVRGSPDK